MAGVQGGQNGLLTGEGRQQRGFVAEPLSGIPSPGFQGDPGIGHSLSRHIETLVTVVSRFASLRRHHIDLGIGAADSRVGFGLAGQRGPAGKRQSSDRQDDCELERVTWAM